MLVPIKEDITIEPHLQPYKENCFLFLSTPKDAGFHIGLKYLLFYIVEDKRYILSTIPLFLQKTFWEKLYFRYTQQSVWDWNESLAPFEDHNFNPELFWCSDDGNACKIVRTPDAVLKATAAFCDHAQQRKPYV